MASVHSPIRTFIKPVLFKLLGNRFYKYAQAYGKLKDIKQRLVEEKEMELLPNLVSKGSQTIDVGANYAYFTERLSKLVGENGFVYAFEPIPFTFSVLELIVKRLRLKNAKIFQKGVADKNATVEFTVPKMSYGTFSAGQAHISDRRNDMPDKKEVYNFDEEEKFNCQIVALDEFIGDELSDVSFIKIDIEGAEYFAMKGMERIILKHRPAILIEICPSFLRGFNISEDDLLNYIFTLGYEIYHYDQKKKKLILLDQKLWESNFILLNKERLSEYQSIIL